MLIIQIPDDALMQSNFTQNQGKIQYHSTVIDLKFGSSPKEIVYFAPLSIQELTTFSPHTRLSDTTD
jgi:hypothetical protein